MDIKKMRGLIGRQCEIRAVPSLAVKGLFPRLMGEVVHGSRVGWLALLELSRTFREKEKKGWGVGGKMGTGRVEIRGSGKGEWCMWLEEGRGVEGKGLGLSALRVYFLPSMERQEKEKVESSALGLRHCWNTAWPTTTTTTSTTCKRMWAVKPFNQINWRKECSSLCSSGPGNFFLFFLWFCNIKLLLLQATDPSPNPAVPVFGDISSQQTRQIAYLST